MDDKFAHYLATGKAGDHFVYHVGGHLMTTKNKNDLPPVVWDVRRAYNEGRIDLVQRRLSHGGNSKFAYAAVKRARISRPKVAVTTDGKECHLFHIPD